MKRVLSLSIFALMVCGCSGEDTAPQDAGQPPRDAAITDAGQDAGLTADTGVSDSGPADTGVTDTGVTDTGVTDTGVADAGPADSGIVDAGALPFTLVSSAYAAGGMIPPLHSCRGEDLQPELTWSNPPAGTMSYAIILIDESIDFTHWVAYDIPANTSDLAEGASDRQALPRGTREASAYCTQFCGPCPRSTHTYTFTIYALDVATIAFGPSGGFGQSAIDRAFGGRVLGEASLTATFTP